MRIREVNKALYSWEWEMNNKLIDSMHGLYNRAPQGQVKG